MKKEVLQKFYLNYRLYLFPIVVALSSLILIGFVIYPQTVKLISDSKLEADLKSRSKLMEAKAQTLDNYDEADLARKVDSLLAVYPQEKDFTNIIGLLQRLMAEKGFKIVSLGLGQSTAEAASQSYNVKLEILGPKALLPNLVTNIEASTRIMRVSSIEINFTPQANIISGFLGIEVPGSSLPSTFGTVSSPLPILSSQEEELIIKLASQVSVKPPVALVPRGKANPFE